jgi:hypothetical protein
MPLPNASARKTVSLQHHPHAEDLTRFEMEAGSASALDHPMLL